MRSRFVNSAKSFGSSVIRYGQKDTKIRTNSTNFLLKYFKNVDKRKIWGYYQEVEKTNLGINLKLGY